jgi:hypothetical protein
MNQNRSLLNDLQLLQTHVGSAALRLIKCLHSTQAYPWKAPCMFAQHGHCCCSAAAEDRLHVTAAAATAVGITCQVIDTSDSAVLVLLQCSYYCRCCCCCCCRSAIKLLQLVALPAGSPAATQLLQTLAAKACDKDAAFAAAALELLVQLDAAALCSSLTGEQFAAIVQAGLELCSSSSTNNSKDASVEQQTQETAAAAAAAEENRDVSATKGGTETVPVIAPKAGGNSKKRPAAGAASTSKQAGVGAAASRIQLSSAGKQQFLQLLRDVLLCDVAEAQHSQQQLRSQGVRQWLVSSAGRAVGVGGCRQLLLMLLQEGGLEETCERLAVTLAAA